MQLNCFGLGPPGLSLVSLWNPKEFGALAGAGGQQEVTQLTVLPTAQDTPKQGSVHLPALIQHSELCQSGTAKLR